jgi:hypothetical protein
MKYNYDPGDEDVKLLPSKFWDGPVCLLVQIIENQNAMQKKHKIAHHHVKNLN